MPDRIDTTKREDMATVLEGALANANDVTNDAYRGFAQNNILKPLFGTKVPKQERQANWEQMRLDPDRIGQEQAFQASRVTLPAHAPISRDWFEAMARLEKERNKALEAPA